MNKTKEFSAWLQTQGYIKVSFQTSVKGGETLPHSLRKGNITIAFWYGDLKISRITCLNLLHKILVDQDLHTGKRRTPNKYDIEFVLTLVSFEYILKTIEKDLSISVPFSHSFFPNKSTNQ